MASKAKAIKQEPSESKLEARSALNKALEAAEAENERDQDLDDDYGDDADDKIDDRQDEEMPDEEENDDEDFTPTTTKQTKYTTKIQQPKPVQQASYIMKLFDRSVNLAKFDEETPLYPLCRAWMKNQPRATSIKSEKSSESSNVQTLEDGDVIEIPKVRIRSKTKPLLSRPDNKINKKDFDKKIDSEIWTKEKLFEYHKSRWQEERERHIENSRVFEEKHFAANFELLESLMKEDGDE
ncbi:hypothetical protein PVAND_008225 [Polypedilum vanderplanki]|uniref:Uncharacterized protein n=1 Tax=Polypedilum vanderplanki TaxID=319348 RepID=A0A9J6C9J7_POLVA|nr:hypothetical protein PVAND_008225 [Polypedilum vanderplanki]